MRWLERNVFLFDGLGAVASTIATLLITVAFRPWFGMPLDTLWLLLAGAVGFSIYSLTCWRRNAPLRPWLPLVMTANLGYCVALSLSLLLHTQVLTPLGLAYFVGEIIVIVGVVMAEWQVLRRHPR